MFRTTDQKGTFERNPIEEMCWNSIEWLNHLRQLSDSDTVKKINNAQGLQAYKLYVPRQRTQSDKKRSTIVLENDKKIVLWRAVIKSEKFDR